MSRNSKTLREIYPNKNLIRTNTFSILGGIILVYYIGSVFQLIRDNKGKLPIGSYANYSPRSVVEYNSIITSLNIVAALLTILRCHAATQFTKQSSPGIGV